MRRTYERGVQAEDLRPGDHVTIFRLHCGEPSPLIGLVLTVLAVDLPFVAVAAPAFWCCLGLDTRVMEFKRLSPEYVAAMLTALPPGGGVAAPASETTTGGTQ